MRKKTLRRKSNQHQLKKNLMKLLKLNPKNNSLKNHSKSKPTSNQPQKKKLLKLKTNHNPQKVKNYLKNLKQINNLLRSSMSSLKKKWRCYRK